ncbi:MAG: hypothetical protein LIR50_11650 [Bacillota bacterium]|nr:hypothetical protein [Bacillota bacterium]
MSIIGKPLLIGAKSGTREVSATGSSDDLSISFMSNGSPINNLEMNFVAE